MGKIITLAGVLVVGALVMKNCGAVSSQSVSFEGTWQERSENKIMGRTAETTVDVLTDGKIFKIKRDSFDPDYNARTITIDIYDGENLITSSEYDGAMGAEKEPPTTTKINKNKAELMQFWLTVLAKEAEAGPGGTVAGQETLLYQARQNRPDGKATVQTWLDAETGLVLKSVVSVFSSQVDMEILRETLECTSLTYRDVSEGEITSPN